MANNSQFSMDSVDLNLLGAGINAGLQFSANESNYKLQLADTRARMDTLKLGFVEREAQRAFQTNEALANIKVSAARRGLATGQETAVAAAIKQAERQTRADFINVSNRERSLLFQQDVAKFNKKMADINAGVSLLSSAITSAATGGI